MANWTTGFTKNGGNCVPIWGDGLRVAGEACDDTNTASGDGWNSTWTAIESNYCNINIEFTYIIQDWLCFTSNIQEKIWSLFQYHLIFIIINFISLSSS